MSQPSPFGPFPPAAPKPFAAAPAVAIAAPGPFRFEYLRAYNYIFENPNWLSTVLMWSVCALAAGFIPILPYLLIVGHMFEMVESLYHSRGKRYPDFDLNRFSEYLGRGIWPMLAVLVAMIPMLVVIYGGLAAVVAVVMGASAAGGDDLGPVLAVVVGVLGVVVIMAIMIGVGLILTPMMLRAGLQQEFAAAFDFAWAMDFVKKTWVEMVLAMLFMNLTGVLLEIVGLLAFCVGLYPAMAIMMMGQTYMLYQLYALYLSRGGTPVPLKPQMPTASVGYIPPPPPGYTPPQQY